MRIFFGRSRAHKCAPVTKIPTKRRIEPRSRNPRFAPRRLGTMIRAISHRRLEIRPRMAHWLIYTDAATSPTKLCALLFEASASRPSCLGQFSDAVPEDWVRLLRGAARIYGVELLALVAIVERLAPRLQGCCVWFYLGQNNLPPVVTRGDSNTCVIASPDPSFGLPCRRFRFAPVSARPYHLGIRLIYPQGKSSFPARLTAYYQFAHEHRPPPSMSS